MTNPFEFIQQVRSEASKVVWPTRRETLVTTGLVLLLVVFASLFFTVVDEVLRVVVGLVLGIGRRGYAGCRLSARARLDGTFGTH